MAPRAPVWQVLALAAIRLYQQYISPRKGFSCAHRVHLGGLGCSAYGYRVIERTGLAIGIRLLRRRLRHCHAAHLAFSEMPAQGRPRLAWQQAQGGFVDLSCDCPSADCAGADGSCAADALGTACDCDLPDFGKKKNKAEDSKAWERAKAYNEQLARDQAERRAKAEKYD